MGNGTKIRGLFTLPHSPNYWIRYAGPDGRMRRESTGMPNKALALKILSKRRTEVAENKFLDKRRVTRMTFRQLCDRYLSL